MAGRVRPLSRAYGTSPPPAGPPPPSPAPPETAATLMTTDADLLVSAPAVAVTVNTPPTDDWNVAEGPLSGLMVTLLLCESLPQFALWLLVPVMVAVMRTDVPTTTEVELLG